jgi:hypothetical protein
MTFLERRLVILGGGTIALAGTVAITGHMMISMGLGLAIATLGP